MALAAMSDVGMMVGGGRVMEAGIELARRARYSLSSEQFILQDPRAREAFAGAWQTRGLPGSLIVSAHPQIIEQVGGVVGPRVAVAHYGGLVPTDAPTVFIHTKTTAIDKSTANAAALLSSGSYGHRARLDNVEIAGLVHGDAALAIHELADSLASRDGQRQRVAIAFGRKVGVYVTDPVTHERGLPNALSTLVMDEPRRLTVAMKTFVDTQFAQEIATRRVRDGIDIDVIVEVIDEESHDTLRGAGVRLLRPSESAPELHGNAIIAEGLQHAYWGTMWASPRGFGRDQVPNLYTGGGALLPAAKRWDRSREIGGITNSRAAIAVLRDGLASLDPQPHDFRASGRLILRSRGGL